MYFLLAFSMSGTSAWAAALVTALVKSYGYLGVFVLMLLEAASFPVPSEVVLPLAGYLAHMGTFNFYIALAVATLGSMIGSVIDYAVGYYLGKEVVYKHLAFFHIKRKDLENFDSWFAKNQFAAVFFTRFIPIIRTLINFPAGFARMSLKRFLLYTFAGVLVWDIVLMAFGFYALSAHSASVVLAAVAVFAILLYVVYRLASSRMRRK